jgi:hypothetical protein
MATSTHFKGQAIRDELSSVEQKVNMTWGEVIRFIFYSVCLVSILVYQIEVYKAYQISAGIKSVIVGDEEYKDIYSASQLVEWIQDTLLPGLAKLEDHVGYKSEDEKYKRLAWFNRVLTPLRFVQKRVKLIDNPNDSAVDAVPMVWKVPSLPLYEASEDESTESYGPGGIFEYDSDVGVDNSGGFPLYLESDFHLDDLAQQAKFLFLENKWIDGQTACLYMDLATYNGHYGMMTYIAFEFIFHGTGYIDKSINIYSLRFSQYTYFVDYVRATFECIYAILTFLYGLMLFLTIKELFRSYYIEYQSKGLNIQRASYKIFIRTVKHYFSDIWNILDTTSIVVSFISISLWLSYITNDSIQDTEDITLSPTLINDMLQVAKTYKSYIKFSSINIMIIFFRVLKYLANLERVSLLIATFSQAKNQILNFFIMLLEVFLAFSLFGYLAFGEIDVGFKDLGLSIRSCLLILLGESGVISSLIDKSIVVTAIFFISFTFLVNFILLNMFIAMISSAYNDRIIALEESKAQKNDYIRKHFIFRLQDYLKKVWGDFIGYFSKKRRLAKKYEAQKEIIEQKAFRANKQVIKDYKDYYNDYEHIDEESLTDQQKILKTSELKLLYSKKFWSAMVYICFVIIYTICILHQQDVLYKYSSQSTVRFAIESVKYSEIDDLDIHDVSTFSELVSWLTIGASNITNYESENYYIMKNYLVGQDLSTDDDFPSQGPFRITIRRLERIENPDEPFREIEPKVRMGAFKAEDLGMWEQTDNYKSFKYHDESGYGDEGGLIFFLSAEGEDFQSQVVNIVSLGILDDSINSLVLEFVLYNGDLNQFIYSAVIFEFNSSGNILKYLNIWPICLNMYASPKDIARCFFEVIYVILVFYHIYVSIRTIRLRVNHYNEWYSRFSETLTKEEKAIRELHKPEWIRRVTNIIDSYIFLDLISFSISLSNMFLWFSIISRSNEGLELPVKDTDFYDYFNILSSTNRDYNILSSVNLLLIYIRIIKYLRMSKSLSFLQNTLNEAMVDIMYFMIMLGVMLFGFVFMAYLVFGTMLEEFSTIGMSLMYCFAMLVGSFDYPKLESADKVMAPIFFFTYMICNTFVVLNIFVSILEVAYARVKKKHVGGSIIGSSLIQTIFSCVIQSIKKILSQRRQQIKEDKQDSHYKDLAFYMFQRIDTGLDYEDDPEIWANKYSEHILGEKAKRAEIKNPLDELFITRKNNELEGGIFKFTSQKLIQEERVRRIRYWNYLRVGYQHLSVQDKKIQSRTEKIVSQCDMKRYEIDSKKSACDEDFIQVQQLEHKLERLRKRVKELSDEVE